MEIEQKIHTGRVFSRLYQDFANVQIRTVSHAGVTNDPGQLELWSSFHYCHLPKLDVLDFGPLVLL